MIYLQSNLPESSVNLSNNEIMAEEYKGLMNIRKLIDTESF